MAMKKKAMKKSVQKTNNLSPKKSPKQAPKNSPKKSPKKSPKTSPKKSPRNSPKKSKADKMDVDEEEESSEALDLEDGEGSSEALDMETEESPEESPAESDETEGDSDNMKIGTAEENAEKFDPYLLKDAEYIKTDTNWKNKQRTLIFASRGISGQHRHLMEDLKKMMPHHKSEKKKKKNQDFKQLNEVAELKSCNNVIFFEARRHEFLYMHVTRVPFGPSFKFQVLNIHTSQEVKLSGNCLLHSRPLLTFDGPFDELPHLKLIKEHFTQAFGTPRNHPKSKPFHDHVMSFYYYDKKIWFRHYQISPLTEDDANDPERQILTEIGPRFVLDPIHVLDGSFGGKKLYANENYASPVARKREEKKAQQMSMVKSIKDKEQKKRIKAEMALDEDPTDDIFT